jgi:SAM-dependent methyltransferase
MNWDLLSSNLSAETIQALKELGISNAQGSENTTEPQMVDRKFIANSVFKKKDYWEERFQSEDSYEWLVSFDHVRSRLETFVKASDKILVLGCGNSPFSNNLYDAGFENIVNIDFSAVVIEKMAIENAEKRPKMQWICMDMLQLDFSDASFDIVIDKAAMDAIMVDEKDVWDPDQHIIDDADRMCHGVSRALKSGGIFFQISFAQPHFRTKYLMGCHAESDREVDPYKSYSGTAVRYNWILEYSSLALENGCLDFFLYKMIKS